MKSVKTPESFTSTYRFMRAGRCVKSGATKGYSYTLHGVDHLRFNIPTQVVEFRMTPIHLPKSLAIIDSISAWMDSDGLNFRVVWWSEVSRTYNAFSERIYLTGNHRVINLLDWACDVLCLHRCKNQSRDCCFSATVEGMYTRERNIGCVSSAKVVYDEASNRVFVDFVRA